MFSVTLGVFPADVSLQNITLGGETMSWTEAQYNIHLKQILFSNGSHAYELQVPFSHPMVTQKVGYYCFTQLQFLREIFRTAVHFI